MLTVLTVARVLPAGPVDAAAPEPAGPTVPVGPDPVTDGGGDRLVVVSPTAVPDRPSATLLAAQQLSEEAGRRPHLTRGPALAAADRRLRRQRALLAERRADRAGPAAG